MAGRKCSQWEGKVGESGPEGETESEAGEKKEGGEWLGIKGSLGDRQRFPGLALRM